jgi:hypothetical protein
VGNLICPLVELAICHLLVAKSQRNRLWAFLGLLFEELMNALVAGIIRHGIVPVEQQLVPFGFVQGARVI